MKLRYRILILLALFIPCFSILPQAGSQPPADKNSPQGVLTAYVTAVRHYDAESLDKLFDKEYVEVSPLGEVDDRAKTLSFYRVPADQRPPLPDDITLDEVQVRSLSANDAIAIARETVTMTLQGTKVSRAFRATFALHKSNGTWRLFSAQFTAMRPVAK